MSSLVTLPITWRPRRSRIVAYILAATVTGGALLLAFILPAPFKLPDRIGVFVFGLLVAGMLHLLGRLRVTADESGVTVVNALRTRRYEWAEVLEITLEGAEPWAKIDLADGTVVSAMAIQGAEPARADQAIAELTYLIKRMGEAPDK